MTERPIRITIATENMFGGTGVHTAALADFLAAAGDQVRVVMAPDEAENPTGVLVLPKDPRVEVVGPIRGDSGVQRQQMVAAVRAGRPEVVFHGKGAPTEGGFRADVALRLTAPLVVFEHDAPPTAAHRLGWNGWRPSAGLYQRVPRWLNGWRHHLASRVVTNSASTQAKQQQFYGGSVDEVVPLGIDLVRFTAAGRAERPLGGPITIGLVGRPDIFMKGLDLAFGAIAELARRGGPGVVWLFPIAAKHRPAIERLLVESGAASFVELIDPPADADLPALYRRLDALLVASRFEGGPYTMLEAMACGTPVVATPVGLVPDVIEDGVNGIRVSATDSVPALVEGIERFLALSPEARAEMGGRAREIIGRNHDAEHHFARLRAILHEVAGR
ncbi:MAG: glycosyltransferase family 4 protein [Gemmatimonadales bacterium]|nr:glycosyltransferase family 4 protein [Gemmatimonadales bacterium]MBP6570821.1 glycosyltransferase family 4 protein [Gemmatimonadales bacterium]MBP9899077.1 glycosyltransferase family 4 protein [Gemmatimonadales bacterium]